MTSSPAGNPTQRASVLASAVAGLLIAQQVGAKAVRDALFLSHFAASRLPLVMVAGALLGIAAAPLAGRLMVRQGPGRCVPWLCALDAGLFALEYALFGLAPAAVAVMLYVHIASLGAVLVSAFWSAINERFDPHTAKHVVGRIGAGATLGGVLGGLATERLGRVLPIGTMLLGFALLNALAAAFARGLREPAERRRDRAGLQSAAASEGGLQTLRRSAFLRELAILVGLLAVTDAWIDYVFKAEADRVLGGGEALLGYFAWFYTATAVVTFVLQAALNERALRLLGLGGAVSLLPGATVVLGAVAAFAPGLSSIGLLRGVTSVIENSLYRSGYELFYTPLAPGAKRVAKAELDVAVTRAATVLGSGAALVALALSPGLARSLLLLGAVVLCLAALLLSLRLHAGYVQQLARGLQAGAVQLDAGRVVDRATLRTLRQSAQQIGREPSSAGFEGARAARAGADAPAAADDSWLERAAALRSDDPARVRAVLQAPLHGELIGLALPWLADDALADAVTRALEPLAAQHSGQLVDALLDRTRPDALRRRLPAVLSQLDGARVQRGLFAALDDPHPEVRSRAARALQLIAGRGVPCAVSQAEVFAAVRRELDRSRPAAAPSPPDGLAADERALQLVFSLLELVLEREALELSLQAALGDDARLRGTALEYLDNVLPSDIRQRLGL